MSVSLTQSHKFQVGQILIAKNSGKPYRVDRLRSDAHPKLKGELGYHVIGQRDGKNCGPVRLMRESAFSTPAA